MPEARAKRKIAAILSADVVGYSRLMEADEEATVRMINAYREIVKGHITGQNGRVVDAKGDNVLAEFRSVVDALRCAVDIQREVGERNTELPEARRMQFRIGVNLGDVIEEKETLYGDGVNIAARLEALADPGGIAISGTAFDSVGKKLPLGYEFVGEQQVKNIERPIRVYRVLTAPEHAGKVMGEERRGLPKWQRTALAALVGLILLAGGLSGWNYLFPPPDVEPASVDKMAHPLPDRPSLAVLPFEDLTGEAEQAFFSDGLTEDIITSLSRVPDLFVIARDSTSTYKGKPVKIKQVAEDLGVRYVLQGSVRKAGERMRITVQLIDAITGHHIWAERYDREAADIFALQDEITHEILISLQVQLTEGEQAKSWRKGTKNIKAYEKMMEALGYLRRFKPADNSRARALYQEAIELDPECSVIYACIGWTHIMPVWNGYSKSPQEDIQLATEYAQKALELGDESEPEAYAVMAWIHIVRREFDKALELMEQAVSLAPNGANNIVLNAAILDYSGRWEEGIPLYEKALRLNPIPQKSHLAPMALAYFMVGRYADAIETANRALEYHPDQWINYIFLAVSYTSLSRTSEAEVAVKQLLTFSPNYSVRGAAKFLGQRWRNQSDVDLFAAALRKAGVPE